MFLSHLAETVARKTMPALSNWSHSERPNAHEHASVRKLSPCLYVKQVGCRKMWGRGSVGPKGPSQIYCSVIDFLRILWAEFWG